MTTKKPQQNDINRTNTKIGQIVDACKNIINEHKAASKNENKNASDAKIEADSKSKFPKGNDISPVKALENVIYDMTTILHDLRSIKNVSKQLEKKYSPKAIEHDLELHYQRQKDEQAKKQREENLNQKNNNNKHVKTNNGSVKSQSSNKSKQNSTNAAANNKPKPNSAPNKVTSNNKTSTNKPNSAQSNEVKKAVTTHKVAQPKPTLQRIPLYTPRAPIPIEHYNPLGILKAEVALAIAEKKTFTVKGCFPVIRNALLQRGWTEKIHPHASRSLPNDEMKRFYIYGITELVDLLRIKETAETVKKVIKSKLLQDHQVDFYWDNSYDAYKECPDHKKLTYINRIRRVAQSFTSKQGLCETTKDWLWLEIPNLSGIRHPRAYILSKGGDTKEFLRDFELTAAISLLKWIVYNDSTKECKIVSSSGKVSLKYFDFAITECYKFIKTKKHQDIDETICDASELEWNEFVDQFYEIVHIGHHFKLGKKKDVEEMGNIRKDYGNLLDLFLTSLKLAEQV